MGEELLFKNSLKIAVQLARTERFEDYYSGFRAYEKWIEELGKYLASSKPGIFDMHEENLTIFNYLLDSRRAVPAYIGSMTGTKKMKRADSIMNNYKEEVRLLEDAQQNTLPSLDSKPQSWTEDIIKAQIDILTQVLRLEKEAIAMIEEEISD